MASAAKPTVGPEFFFEIPRDWFEPYNYARKETGLESGDFTMNAFAQTQPPLMQIRP